MGPAVIGIRRPRIVVPAALAERLRPAALASVLAHEREHAARRDPLLLALAQLAAAVAWPVLPAWLSLARVRLLLELACDEAALAAPGAATPAQYGETLLAVARLGSAAPAPAFGGPLESRFRALGRRARWGARRASAVVAPLSLALLLAVAPRARSSGEGELLVLGVAIYDTGSAPDAAGRLWAQADIGVTSVSAEGARRLAAAHEHELLGSARITVASGERAEVSSAGDGIDLAFAAAQDPETGGFGLVVDVGGAVQGSASVSFPGDHAALVRVAPPGGRPRTLLVTVRPATLAPGLASFGAREDDLRDVLLDLAEASRRPFLVHPDVRARVTLPFAQTPWRSLLESAIGQTPFEAQVGRDVVRVGPAGWSGGADGPLPLVLAHWKDAPVAEVLAFFARATGARFAPDADAAGRRITLRLRGVDLEHALPLALVAAGLEALPADGEGRVRVSPRADGAVE